MLTLGRKVFQPVYIDVAPSDKPTRIEVVVVEIARARCRLGFTTDRTREEVVFTRSELLEGKEPES